MSADHSTAFRERLEALFDAVADLPRAEHAAFIERECGADTAMRAELVGLLDGLAGEDILHRMQPGAPTRAGSRIGAYELLERVGEGGMGEVYEARQLEPVVRRVALKIIKPGMDSALVVARFEAERQALARMSHPNIAQVFDGGTTESGSPYFVMEFVDGVPITDYCDAHKLSTVERIELFVMVCDAVQHAHQKGIIHRDLKPSNLLVTMQDARAIPKIIDFGVARATTGRLSANTLHTLIGQVLGTLDYMSPEQADPTSTDVDTRSDVYSLGVVLYQLLSGLLPLEHKLTADTPFSEIQRDIREKDPPTPSTRLKRRTGTATVVAPLHGTDERSLLRQLSGDLDWICMKALEKDPVRRYASANELAQDLRRHLAHEPVLAGRPDALYRARKFVRRHRVGVTAAALIFVASMVGIVGIVSGRIEALASEQRAVALQPQADDFRARQLVARADAPLAPKDGSVPPSTWPPMWPPHPAMIQAYESWSGPARSLAAALPKYRARLSDLESRAVPLTDAERRADRDAAPGADTLRRAKERLLALTSADAADPADAALRDARIEKTKARIKDLEASVSVRRTWNFDSDEDRSSREVLKRLVDELETLSDGRTGLIGEDSISPTHGWSVPKRLAFARELESGFQDGGPYARAWSDALPQIRAAYPGLDLRAQMGLVPLGPDPDSHLWEFAHLMSGVPAVRGENGKLMLAPETGIVLVLLPGGSFWMGSQNKDPNGHNYYDGHDYTNPLHVSRDLLECNADGDPLFVQDLAPFFISKYEMTQSQWERTSGENPSRETGMRMHDAPSMPVNKVTWSDCNRTMIQLGLVLPSELQWEFAARAATESPWWTGTEERSLIGAANVFDQTALSVTGGYAQRSSNTPAPWADGQVFVAVIGSFRANGFGLHDVCGNVAEWCANPLYEYGTTAGTANDIGDNRTSRGGSSRESVVWCRSSARRDGSKSIVDPAQGLRPAREIDP